MAASGKKASIQGTGNAAKARTARTPSRTGGYFLTRKARTPGEIYADAMREIHDPGTEHYWPVRGIVTRSHTGIVGEFPSTKVCV